MSFAVEVLTNKVDINNIPFKEWMPLITSVLSFLGISGVNCCEEVSSYNKFVLVVCKS